MNCEKVSDYRLLRNHQCSLQETSKDTSQEPNQFMTTCTKTVVDFDSVKTAFLGEFGQPDEKARSVDALVIDENIKYLIEFKNGDFKQREIFDKAKDSILILNSILNRQIDDSRQSDVFILVYNQDKKNIDEKEKIAMGKAKKAKQLYTLFGLGKLEGFCFSKVFTLNKQQFEELIVEENGW